MTAATRKGADVLGGVMPNTREGHQAWSTVGDSASARKRRETS